MKLYHGSKTRQEILKPFQAENPSGEPKPEGELLNAIYFSPKLEFAVAMAVRPPGLTEIDNNNHKITFEHPEYFNPETDIYIHEVDSNRIAKENLNAVDERVVAVTGIEELKSDAIKTMKAREVLNYYELTNWKEGSEIREINRK